MLDIKFIRENAELVQEGAKKKRISFDVNKLIEVGTKPETRIEVLTPLIDMKKEEIVLKGIELSAPLHLTWSCYKNNDKACGVCDSCALRIKGFKKAGVKDPIEYAVPIE